MTSILQRIAKNGNRLAFVDSYASYSYGHLQSMASRVSNELNQQISLRLPEDKRQPRVAYMCPRDHSYIAAKLGAWHSGSIGVPIAENYPTAEIEYVLGDSGASAVVAHSSMMPQLEPAARRLGIPIVQVDSTLAAQTVLSSANLAIPNVGEGAMMIYTSGTTGRPKGVLHTHKMLEAQIDALSQAWGWTENDRILNVLPLHHVHGVTAVLLSALWNGAVCEMAPKFDAAATWAALTRTSSTGASARFPGAAEPLTVFMAVPTVYARLVEHYEKQPKHIQDGWSSVLRSPDSQLRLMVSGSAALPEPLAVRWRAISGHQLLERYGMSEFAMAISNPLNGTRKINSVGLPLPRYEARIVPEASDDNTTAAAASASNAYPGPGELQIRGPGVFSEYWNRPQATAESFTADGWFKTGDCAERDADGYYNILGRLSADILKSGGYKISALEIERILLDHPSISELAVFGIPDPVYGEKIAAVVVPKEQASAGADQAAAERKLSTEVRSWAKDRLAPYKMPTVWRILDSMPRNAMGKINKKELRKNLFG